MLTAGVRESFRKKLRWVTGLEELIGYTEKKELQVGKC